MLYRMAYDQVQHNIAIIKPGMAFREIADKAWKIPERFVDQRYTSVMHGVGMHGETPFIAHAMDYETYGREGISCRAWWSASKAISARRAAARASSSRRRS